MNNMDTKAKLIVAAAGVAVAVAAAAAGITAQVRKRRTCAPLPGTVKVEKLIIVKTPKK